MIDRKDIYIINLAIRDGREQFYRSIPDIRFCKIEKKIEKSIVFEMHEEHTGEFLLSAATNLDASEDFIFTRNLNLHIRPYVEILKFVDPYCSTFFGKLKKSSFGLKFACLNYEGNKLACLR